eukprot:1177515-Prorocentrum_minimum.AAC.7
MAEMFPGRPRTAPGAILPQRSKNKTKERVDASHKRRDRDSIAPRTMTKGWQAVAPSLVLDSNRPTTRRSGSLGNEGVALANNRRRLVRRGR